MNECNMAQNLNKKPSWYDVIIDKLLCAVIIIIVLPVMVLWMKLEDFMDEREMKRYRTRGER